MWLSTLFARRRQPITGRKLATARLSVERLEDREVPASLTAANVSELITAINTANLTSEKDTITLGVGKSFTLASVHNTMNGPTGLPVIAAEGGGLSIIGNGNIIERSAAPGTPAFRLFDVDAGASLTLEGLTLQGGLAFGFGAWAHGGAVHNRGTLILDGVTVQDNTAQGNDGFRIFNTNTSGGNAFGGGVYSIGVLTMLNCNIQNNISIGGKGADGFLAPPSMPGSSEGIKVRGSDGGDGYGGGLYVGDGMANITSSALRSNIAQGSVGGSGYKGSGNGDKGDGIGGGLYIDTRAVVCLDAFTATNVKRNRTSTSDPNIRGSYGIIP